MPIGSTIPILRIFDEEKVREFDIHDPDGHIIGFGQDLVPSATAPVL